MKKLLSLALAGVMALSLAACGSTPSSTPASTPASGSTSASTPASEPAEEFETVDLRVAYMPNMGSNSLLATALNMGYFEEMGLNVTLTEFQGGPAEIAAMASGDIDISQIGHGAHALCIEGQAKIFHLDCTSLADAVVANTDKGISSIADLKGKTIAVSSGTSAEIILNLALASAGLTQDDVDHVLPHQANIRIIETAMRKLKIPHDRYHINIQHSGNTSSACIPVLLDELNRL